METKVPFYNIVNVFLPGLILIGSCMMLFLDDTKELVGRVTILDSTGFEVLITASCFAIAYEVGYVIFRLGAVAIEPALKKMFGWADYKDFIAAGKANENAHDKLEMLSREYGYARTQITLFLALVALTGTCGKWWLMTVCLLCVALFTLTARGHIKKIQIVMKQYLATNSNESEMVSNG